MKGIYYNADLFTPTVVLRLRLARRGKVKINKCGATGLVAKMGLGEFSFRVNGSFLIIAFKSNFFG